MAVKGVLNLFVSEDDAGNPVYCSIYPKTTIDQVEDLVTYISNSIDAKIATIPYADNATYGTVKIGENISTNNGIISLTADNISSALNYIPAKCGVHDAAQYAEQLFIPRGIFGTLFSGEKNICRHAICETESDKSEKIINIDNFVLEAGSELLISFINDNTAENPKLKINNAEPKNILYHSQLIDYTILKKDIIFNIMYDGENYQIIGDLNIQEVRGVKGDLEENYRTGYINISKDNLGLGKVDNTADVEKDVNLAVYSVKDKLGNVIHETYSTILAEQEIKSDIDVISDEILAYEQDYQNKIITTNKTLANLRVDVVNNKKLIDSNIDNINNLQIYTDQINSSGNYHLDKINEIFEELVYIHEDITSIDDTATEGLDTAHSVETKLTETNERVTTAQETADLALGLVTSMDDLTTRAERDVNGKLIHETYATIANPEFTGNPQAPTPNGNSNNNSIATTAFVQNAVASLAGVDVNILNTLQSIKQSLTDDPDLRNSLITSLAEKQDRSDALTNFANLNTKENQFIYTTGTGTYASTNIQPFMFNVLNSETAYAVRDKIQALGIDEKAASAVSADTAVNCIGNSLSANKLAVARKITIIDSTGNNESEEVIFDGSLDTALKLPETADMNITGNAASANKINGVNIKVNLNSSENTFFDGSIDNSTLGVSGILKESNGGTGKSNLTDVKVGTANRVDSIISKPEDVLFVTMDNDFARVRVDVNENTENSYMELATADNANSAILIRQYFGKFDTLHRTLALLDEHGNTQIPGELSMSTLILPSTPSTVEGAIWIE